MNASQTDQTDTPATDLPTADPTATTPAVEEKAAKPAAEKKAAAPKPKPIVVTAADRGTLIWVAGIQKKATQRHLQGCQHFWPVGSEKDPRWVKASPDQIKALKPCSDCSLNAAKARIATKAAK